MKTNREAGNCWTSLLEGEYCANAWVQNQMQKKLTLERFQREVRLSVICLRDSINRWNVDVYQDQECKYMSFYRGTVFTEDFIPFF